jgi:hypothetical protein
MQQVLDAALAQASNEAKTRFAGGVARTRRDELAVAEPQRCDSDAPEEQVDDAAGDPVFAAPWDQRGSVKASVALSSSGSSVEPRRFSFRTGTILTAPAHPEPGTAGVRAIRR